MSEETLSYLKQIPPFKDLADETFDQIADTVEDVQFKPGTVIIKAGDEGDSLYIIKKGTVEVYIFSPDDNEKIVLSQLGENDYFGEMALITGESRSAYVAALEPVECLRLEKRGFDQIIEENPSISLSLSHMLSQRLKNANLMRAKSESLFHERIAPSGDLKETSFWELLKFCEQNSLTGVLRLTHNQDKAQVLFQKGNVQEVSYGNLTEAEAMDALMQWTEGNFIIEPQILSLEKPEEKKSNGSEMEKDTQTVIENLVIQSFEKLRSAVGSQALKDIVKNSCDHLIPYFQELKSWKFEVLPRVRIDLKNNQNDWNDKKTLAIAVFLQTVIKNCTPLVVGMSYLNLRALAAPHTDVLNKISFFEYMDHADEFAV